jgi:hypothetical protein
MRKAFISYSLADKDRFVVSKLTSALQEHQMVVLTSQNFYSPAMDFTTQKNIELSDLFLGIITDQSHNSNRVLEEWQFAIQQRIPSLLAIEDTLVVQNINQDDIIRFNRNHLDYAINSLKQKVEYFSHKQSNDEWIKWVLGGAAVIAILSLLNKNK